MGLIAVCATVLGFGLLTPQLASAETFTYLQKLELNPLPGTDSGKVYWHGTGKMASSNDVWKLTVTMGPGSKSQVGDIITIGLPGWFMVAENLRTGSKFEKTFTGQINLYSGGSVVMQSTDGTGTTLNGIVRSMWTDGNFVIKRRGPNVIQGVINIP